MNYEQNGDHHPRETVIFGPNGEKADKQLLQTHFPHIFQGPIGPSVQHYQLAFIEAIRPKPPQTPQYR